MRIDIVSIFPGIFEGTLSTSMLGMARDKGLLDVVTHDLRDWALPGVHRQVDDAPYGGGPGMVMRPEPFFDAVEAIRPMTGDPGKVVLMCPQGRLLDQRLVEELAHEERLIVLCGRYEGFDERIRSLADMQVSVGDYVLTGGELPAMVLVDAVSRLIPGVLGGDESATEESFSWGLLEYPQYTRPASHEGMDVPPVLLSGDHGRIAKWRREQAVLRTAAQRPDILAKADLSAAERELATRTLAEMLEDADDGATGSTDEARDAGFIDMMILRIIAQAVMVVAVSFAFAALMRAWVVQPYFIPSGSMRHTLEVGDQVIVDRLAYVKMKPRRGDVVVFRDPEHRYPVLIKRVIAVGGQTVDIREGRVYVEGRAISEPYVSPEERDTYTLDRPVRVPKGYVWVMGDDRARSVDSRMFGPQPLSAVRGRAMAVYWPLPRAERL